MLLSGNSGSWGAGHSAGPEDSPSLGFTTSPCSPGRTGPGCQAITAPGLPSPSPLREGWGWGVGVPSLAKHPAQTSLGRTRAPGVTGASRLHHPSLLPQRRPWTQAPRDTQQTAGREADAWLCTLLLPPPPGEAPSPGGTGKRGWETRGRQQGQGRRLGSLVEWAAGHPSSRAHSQRNAPTEPDQGSDTKRSAPDLRLLTPHYPLPHPPGAA